MVGVVVLMGVVVCRRSCLWAESSCLWAELELSCLWARLFMGAVKVCTALLYCTS